MIPELPTELWDLIFTFRSMSVRAWLLSRCTFSNTCNARILLKTPTRYAVPFHNMPPFDMFTFTRCGKTIDFCVGLWANRNDEIYIVNSKELRDMLHCVDLNKTAFEDGQLSCIRMKHATKKWVENCMS